MTMNANQPDTAPKPAGDGARLTAAIVELMLGRLALEIDVLHDALSTTDAEPELEEKYIGPGGIEELGRFMKARDPKDYAMVPTGAYLVTARLRATLDEFWGIVETLKG